MSVIESLIPTSGLQAWHEADSITGVANGGNVTAVPDKSSHARDLACASSNPTFVTNVQNGLPAVNWSGSQNPLVYSGSFTAKHIFVVGAYADAAFPAAGGAQEYAGLTSGVAGGNFALLVGNPSSGLWFDSNYRAVGTYSYRRRDVVFAENAAAASFSNALSIFEISLDIGWALDGLQIGRDRSNSTRKWKGRWVFDLVYDRVLSDTERFDVYEYLAVKYLLWKRVSSGLDVWPFQPNWTRPLSIDKPVLSSMSVSRTRKSRSKGSAKNGIQPQFEVRGPEEYDAAVAFWNAKYPGTSFIYRDDAFSPARETEMEFTSGITQQAADVHDINYSFSAEEV